jgi:hypothetical protein
MQPTTKTIKSASSLLSSPVDAAIAVKKRHSEYQSGVPFIDPLHSLQRPGLRFQPQTIAKTVLGIDPPPSKNYLYRVAVSFELRETTSRTIDYAFDFMLDTLDYSSDEPSVPLNEAELRLQPFSRSHEQGPILYPHLE